MSVELIGGRLRARRTSLGRTLASVAYEAGLSVPYVANLERGRGNPTLSVLESLSDALGIPLASLFEGTERQGGASLPASVAAFSKGGRFRRETRALADDRQVDRSEIRELLLRTLTALAEASPRPLQELDLHRALDLVVLISRRT